MPVGHLCARQYKDRTGLRRLDEYVVAGNHVHALVAPTGEHTLSGVMHSWKSFTAHRIVKMLRARGDTMFPVWQKETYDHIVRGPASLEKIRDYIRAHREWQRRPRR